MAWNSYPVRGTRNLIGKEAEKFHAFACRLESWALSCGFARYIPSSLAIPELYANQMGDNRMFQFATPGDHRVVLIPEVTAIARHEYRTTWSKTMPKPVCLFYTSRCYRYDRPQRGRWREFTQFGVEQMPLEMDMCALLRECLSAVGLGRSQVDVRSGVKRGLGYYVEDGFEAWAQGMQIAGGGRYEEGAGFAMGVERTLMVLESILSKG
jgi:histidyl-tRNA synthetase